MAAVVSTTPENGVVRSFTELRQRACGACPKRVAVVVADDAIALRVICAS